jgi:hypothetical protein
MRVDPARVMTGVTASRAAVEDGVLAPGEPVPNDYYIRDESHRLLAYRVPANAHVTVLTNPGTGPRSTVVSVAELSQIVKGKSPRKRPGLWGPAPCLRLLDPRRRGPGAGARPRLHAVGPARVRERLLSYARAHYWPAGETAPGRRYAETSRRSVRVAVTSSPSRAWIATT